MSDLISRSALMAKLKGKAKANEILGYMTAYDVTKECIEVVSEQPTVDAKLVIHGEWIEHKWAEEVGGWLISNFECSQCHMWKRYNTNFCPECGADMRKKAK